MKTNFIISLVLIFFFIGYVSAGFWDDMQKKWEDTKEDAEKKWEETQREYEEKKGDAEKWWEDTKRETEEKKKEVEKNLEDPCLGVICSDKCEGNIRYSNGYCSNGECRYETGYCEYGCSWGGCRSAPKESQQQYGSEDKEKSGQKDDAISLKFLRVIPMYDPITKRVEPYDIFMRNLAKELDESGAAEGSDLKKDPVGTLYKIMTDKDYFMNAKIIMNPEGGWLTPREAMNQGYRVNEIEDVLEEQRETRKALNLNDKDKFKTHSERTVKLIRNLKSVKPTTTTTVKKLPLELKAELKENKIVVRVTSKGQPLSNTPVLIETPFGGEEILTDELGIVEVVLANINERMKITITVDQAKYEKMSVIKEIGPSEENQIIKAVSPIFDKIIRTITSLFNW